MTRIDDRSWLSKAIELSRRCPPTEKAFCVGAIILGANAEVISTGYSRERSPHEHAEELAIAKAGEEGKDLSGATIYSSLEPCCPRLSGRTSCADLIINAGIKKVVFALYEPPIVVVCQGADRLRTNGIEVVVLGEFADLVKEINQKTLVSKEK